MSLTGPDGATTFTDDGMEEMAEYDTITGDRTARYDHDPSRIDALLAQDNLAGKVHAVTDALGSVYALADATSAVVSQYSYDVYGERTASAEAVPTKWGFTGRVHERDVPGEMYYRARELDSSVGMFLAMDELYGARQRGAMSRTIGAYGYAASSPVMFVDPLGKQETPNPLGKWFETPPPPNPFQAFDMGANGLRSNILA